MRKNSIIVIVLLTWICFPLSMRSETAREKIELGVTIPAETGLDDAGLRSAAEIWLEMIDGAKTTIDLAEFYLVGRPGSKLEQVNQALERAAARGVKIRILAEKKMQTTYPELLKRFAEKTNITVRLFDWKELTGGILHAKYFLVDGRQCWVGSQNFDWRALEQIHETGIRIEDRNVTTALTALFEADWAFSGGGTMAYDTLRNLPPFIFDSGLRLCASPKAMLPPGVEPTLDTLVALMDGAKKKLTVQLLSYSTDKSEFSVLEEAMKQATARGVAVKLLVSDWSLRPDGQRDLKRLNGIAGIEVKAIGIPQLPSGFIPFARVHHSKVLRVDDDTCVISTSNWSADYFNRSRNVEIILKSVSAAARLDRLFDSLWRSPYTYTLDPNRKYQPPPREAPSDG